MNASHNGNSAMNFYDLLGVSRSATQDEIKAAFRAKALQYHPDRNQNNPEAETKFKEINTAYETLGTPEKRQIYDQQQERMNVTSKTNFVPPEVMFNDLFGGFSAAFHQNVLPRRKLSITITLAETLSEQERFISIPIRIKCSKCFGAAVGKGGRCSSCGGHGCDTCGRTGVRYAACEQCKGTGSTEETKEIKITIPKGIFSSTQLQSNTPYGPVITSITVKYPENIKLGAGGRLIMDVAIPYHVAILGGVHKIDLFEGGKASVKFPPLKNVNQMIKIKGKGLYASPYETERGDLFLSPHVEIPENISEEHKTIVEQLANLYSREVSNNDSTI